MSKLQLMMLIALATQLPLLGLAFLAEFSQRKKRFRLHAIEPQAEAPAVELLQAQAPPVELAQPESLPAETAQPQLPQAETVAPAPAMEAAPLPSPAEVIAAITEAMPQPAAKHAAEPAAPAVEAVPIAEQAAPSVAAAAPAQPQPEAPAAAVESAAPPALSRREPVRFGLGLRKTRENFLARIRAAISGSARVDEIYEGLEEALIGADVGVESSMKIVEAVRARLKNDARAEVIRTALKDEIARILLAAERPMADSGDAPLVIMMTGVNGAGKTTTVAKLAALYKAERGTVVVAAADTFRAAAIEQLQVWCDRAGVSMIKQNQGSDPAAVAFDAVKAAIARAAGTVLIDTAGRLQTKVNLMEELKKIARVVGRELPGAPHETWLVLDATTGQNALSQAKIFGEAVPLTGVVLAKLDSTAKGGVIVGIAERLKLPVRFVGLGEAIEDLRRFDAREFVEALFSDDEDQAAASGTYAA